MKHLLLAAACVLAAGAAGAADAPARPAVLERPAMKTSRATQMAALAITRAGDRLVSVGEAGVVLLSDDNGRHWRQADVPVTVSLTDVQFTDARTGYATGHMGVVLKTTDGGEHWTRIMDGVKAADLSLQRAEAVRAALPADDTPDADLQAIKRANKGLRDARLLVADGPDKPFLGLHFIDADNGFVFGAYNLILRTRDGGTTWTSWSDRVTNPRGLHLYAMAGTADHLFLAGEQGLLLRADRHGGWFEPIDSPYKGSYFGLASTAHGDIVAFGLRGNAFRSSNDGDDWQKIDTGVNASLSSAAHLPDGGLLLVSQRGDLLKGAPALTTFKLERASPPRPIAGLVLAPDGTPVAASLAGVQRLDAKP